MAEAVFKKILFLSLFLHFAGFSLFSFSLKNPAVNSPYTSFYFFGKIFSAQQILKRANFQPVIPKELFKNKSAPGYSLPLPSSYRPALSAGFPSKKEMTAPVSFNLAPFTPERKTPGITFYPVLPYGFSLYFNDRQVAHVELKFRITDKNNPDYAIIKRSISSGNLEVDLLTKRYIQRHLFIERMKIKPISWQTVKIDLSSKND